MQNGIIIEMTKSTSQKVWGTATSTVGNILGAFLFPDMAAAQTQAAVLDGLYPNSTFIFLNAAR